jgi:hypothetical protein
VVDLPKDGEMPTNNGATHHNNHSNQTKVCHNNLAS